MVIKKTLNKTVGMAVNQPRPLTRSNSIKRGNMGTSYAATVGGSIPRRGKR